MKGGRKLQPEERILWGKVVSTTRPLAGHRAELEALETELSQLRQRKEEEAARAAAAKHVQPPANAAQPAAEPSRPRQKTHQPLEKPVKRKLATGRLAIEARIDLHGLFQEDAHHMLLDFLRRAHARRLRHVLVITGKGRSSGGEGVLCRAVPLWFSKPEFAALISSWEWAARHHGGEGALYVRLARRPGERAD